MGIWLEVLIGCDKGDVWVNILIDLVEGCIDILVGIYVVI